MQTQLDIQITSIQAKLQQLFKQYQALQKENEQLKKQLTQANTKTLVQDKVQHLNFENLTSTNNQQEKEILQKRIDKYLQEIDKCLLLLNANL